MEFEKVANYIIERLQNELQKKLYYHCVEHTIDVCEAAERLAILENLSSEEIVLVKTAALFHDSGHIYCYTGHEKKSARIAEDVLPTFGYSSSQIIKISGMIRATEIPQNPQNLMEQILCDADLDYLGRDDFFMNSPRLFREWNEIGITMSLKEWFQQQIVFLEKHQYFTNSAKQLRLEKKQYHIAQVKELMNTAD